MADEDGGDKPVKGEDAVDNDANGEDGWISVKPKTSRSVKPKTSNSASIKVGVLTKEHKKKKENHIST